MDAAVAVVEAAAFVDGAVESFVGAVLLAVLAALLVLELLDAQELSYLGAPDYLQSLLAYSRYWHHISTVEFDVLTPTDTPFRYQQWALLQAAV